MGITACVHLLPDRHTWETVAKEAPAVDQDRLTKHFVPMEGTETALTPLLANANEFELHSEFLWRTFPDEFPDMNQELYRELVLGSDRPFASGNLVELTIDGETRWGFVIWDRPAEADETVTLDQATQVYEALRPMVAELSDSPPLFLPYTDNQVNAAAGWDAPFEIRGFASNIDYEPYTQGVGYGTLRLVELQDLEDLEESGEIGWQDILILDEAPFDLERVVSGVVTGGRQTGLSHLNVRSAARGTPNCFVADALEAFEAYDGALVRLECGESDYSVEVASLDDAEAWWSELQPDPVEVPAPDLETTELVPLLELPTDTTTERAQAVAAYGAKGAQLATLYQRISAAQQLEGFVVPMSTYATFLDGDYDGRTFAETLDDWWADDDFVADAALRRERLEDLREAMRDAPVDAELLEALSDQIEAQWGDDTTMVRVRSSSNAEDALHFSGAGLYDSTSACVADEWDDDDEGPSLCDPDEPRERTLSRAVRKVWASTWNMAAVEERAWYGIDQQQVAMGLLVNTRSDGEQAEAVAFSGDPIEEDDRVRIDAQAGEIGVVAPESGVVPEITRVEIDDGEVIDIVRQQASSETDGRVLGPSEAGRIGLRVAGLSELMPLDAEVPEGHTLLYDTEWKVLSDGRLVIKQVRPFLR